MPGQAYDPTVKWAEIAPTQVFQDAPLADPALPTAPGAVRVVCVSDTHGRNLDHLVIPEGDVLVHAGDFSLSGTQQEVQSIADWLRAQPHKHKVIIAGNHDLSFDVAYCQKGRRRVNGDPAAIRSLLAGQDFCHYLQDEAITFPDLGHLCIYGTPWTPEFCGWAFMADRGEPLQEKWAQIPTGTDVVVVHGPPLGRGDECAHGGRAGSLDLLEEIQNRVKPSLCVYGHIHEGYGASSDGVTTYVNAATCDLKYRARQPAMVVDVVPKAGPRL